MFIKKLFDWILNQRRSIDVLYDEAVRECTRTSDHICAVNGPCNGYPRRTNE